MSSRPRRPHSSTNFDSTHSSPSLDVLRSLAASVGPDDGLDPRRFLDRRARNDALRESKRQALCKLAERVIGLALGGELDDPLLLDLELLRVELAPDATRLRVVLGVTAAMYKKSELTLTRLGAIKGALRSELARALQRRRTPDLIFHLEPAREDSR